MKIDIVFDCDRGEKLAGLYALDWMKDGLSPIVVEKGAAYTLRISKPMPLLDAAFVIKAIGIMNKRGLDGVTFGGGELKRKYAKSGRRVALASIECATLDGANEGEITEKLYTRKALSLKALGVKIFSPYTVYVDGDVEIGENCVIRPFVRISGGAKIGRNCEIGSFCEIEGSVIGDDCFINASVVKNSKIGNGSKVGPYAYLRDNAIVGDRCRIGDYVEIKASSLGEGVKAAHHSYIGDAKVGKGTNVGCGSVFCNYDGKVKREITVGENAFIGSNVNLVAPLKLGNDVYVAAGSTVTKDVEDGAFVIARERETIKRKNM